MRGGLPLDWSPLKVTLLVGHAAPLQTGRRKTGFSSQIGYGSSLYGFFSNDPANTDLYEEGVP